MITYIVRRLIMAVFVLILVTLFVFFAMRILPGDPIIMLLTQTQQQELTQEQIDYFRHEHGLDRPLTIQYIDWLGGAVHGDLGESIQYHSPVAI
jgi:peptide/nickel transport system permease protein